MPNLPPHADGDGPPPPYPDVLARIRAAQGRQFELHDRHVNPQMRRMLHLIGLDADYIRARGGVLTDSAGREYLDFVTHSGVFSIGHNHPHVNASLRAVLSADLPNILMMDCSLPAGLLAERLLAHAPHLGKVWFGNSGSEAVEAALKFARCATGRPRVVSFHGGYHGLTYGALSVVGHEMWREGFAPFLPGCTQIPFNDANALAAELAAGDVAAVVGETLQGDGGVNLPSDAYWPAAAELCRRGTLLVLDEIQVGLDRTGRFFAFRHYGIEPDIVLLSKGLSGGQAPVSAVLVRDAVFAKVFSRMDRCVIHCGTFCENNLSMAAGLATLDVHEAEDLGRRAAESGDYFLSRLRPLRDKYEMIRDIRGRGLIVGIEFGRPRSFGLRVGWDLLAAANAGLFAQMVCVPLHRDHGILAQLAGHNFRVLKLMPPLAVPRADLDRCVAALDAVLAQVHRFPSAIWDFASDLAARVR